MPRNSSIASPSAEDPRQEQTRNSIASNSKRKYPRATVRKIVKAHANKNVGRDVDALVYLDYILFVQRLMANATQKAKQGGEKKIAAKDIRKVTLTTLRQFRG